MLRSSRRRLATLLAVSAMLHGVIIAVLPGPGRLDAASPPVLSVALTTPPPARPQPQSQSQSQPQSHPQPSVAAAPAGPREHVGAKRRIVDAPARTPVLVAEAPPAGATEPAPAVDSPPPRSEAASPPQVAPPPVVPPPNDGPAQFAEYTRLVSDRVAAHRHYPGLARLRGWQGTALVALSVDADGNILDTRISKSSGYDVLDRQARDMVEKANPLPPMPSAGRHQIVQLQLPVTFTLID